MRKSLILVFLCTLSLFALVGCGGSGSTTRFRVHTIQVVAPNTVFDDPGVPNDGYCADCVLNGYPGPLTVFYPLGYTNSTGYRTYEDVYVPANWLLARYQSERCGTPVVNKTAYVGQDDTVPSHALSNRFGARPPAVSTLVLLRARSPSAVTPSLAPPMACLLLSFITILGRRLAA